MKIVGLICEYNPFHTGHKYQIGKIKSMIENAHIVCVMSGDFVQRGDVAILDKHTRTKIALENGADLVILLPTFFCTQVAPIFASGSISLLNMLNCVDYICFGSESGNIEKLKNLSKQKYNEKDMKNYLKNGDSYIKAYSNISQIPNTSNDILAVEYIKSLELFDSNIKPITIKREGSLYNDTNLGNSFASATSIRTSIRNDIDMQKLIKYLPQNSIKYFERKYIKFDEDFYNILKYAILSKKENLKYIFEINEGIENKILENISKSDSVEELIQSVKSKRYTYTRIRRMLFNILLDITKSDMSLIKENRYNIGYARVLGFNDRGRNIIKKIKNNSDIDIVNKVSSYNPKDKHTNMIFQKDIYATKLYNILKKSYYFDDYLTSPIRIES